MTLCDMQSSGNYSMRHQVPMVFLLLIIYLSAVTCISEERNLGQCWRKDILRVNELIEWSLSDAPPCLFFFFFTSFTLSDYCCLHTRN